MQTLEQLKAGKLIGSRSIKLSCGLTEFPLELFVLADTLEVLDLSGNQLSKLPDDFPDFRNLKILFLSENEFTEYPQILGKCSNLDMIGFKANKISSISEESISPNLRWLILTNNHLSQIPKSIGKCSRLQKLMLAGNRLTSLPEEMRNCENLELLRISANRLESFPDWLFSLPKLAWVAFAGNPCSPSFSSHSLDEIDWKNLVIKEKLGEGASGNIYKAKNAHLQGVEVALKVFKGEITSDGLPNDEMFATIAVGSHPNLVKVLGKVSNHPEEKNGLVLELIPKDYKNLGNPPSFETCTRDTFADNLYFSLESILRILFGISSSISHIHSHGITHGDLYAHNILVSDKTFHPLFGDFGAAALYDKNSAYANLIERIEVRAFGCLMEDLLVRVESSDLNSEILKELFTLKEYCLQTNVRDRPDFTQIIERLENIKIQCDLTKL